MACLAIAVDLTATWARVPIGHLGRVPISPGVVLGFVLAAMIGTHALGLVRASLEAWGPFILVMVSALLLGVFEYATRLGGSESLGLITAALGEELVYRLAVVVVAGASCARLLGRDWRNAATWGLLPGVVALMAAGLLFATLPGHVAQMTEASDALPFASLGILFGYVVLRTAALLPAAIVHALLNLATIAAKDGRTSIALRTTLAATALIALVLGTLAAGHQLGLLQRVQRSSRRSMRPASSSMAASPPAPDRAHVGNVARPLDSFKVR